MAAQDIWAALEVAEREQVAKPATKGKGGGQAQQGSVAQEPVLGVYDVGLLGEVEVELRPATYKQPLPPLTDLSPYPLLPTGEDPKLFIRKNYLEVQPSQLKTAQPAVRFWPRSIQDSDLYHLEPSRPTLTLDVITDPQTGEIRGFREIEVGDSTSTATNSTSLVRAPGSLEDFARGSSQNLPFKPGGLVEESQQAYESRVASLQAALDFSQALRAVPPGFDHGLTFDAESGALVVAAAAEKKPEKASIAGEHKGIFHVSANSLIARYAKDVDVRDVLERMRNRDGRRGGGDKVSAKGMFEPGEDDDPFAAAKPAAAAEAEEEEEEQGEQEQEEKKPAAEAPAAPEADTKPEVKLTAPSLSAPTPAKNALDTSLDELLGNEDVITLLDRRVRRKKKQDDVWAVLDSVDVSNFKELVPKMALEYPFDLDTFQKEAVYHLENNESVFVAAHTSAGKTVVAEYAIALCMKHMTRAIYTSPIKALSNQKYRDFKNTFGDVGIITGDVQVNPTASALIVTTEILRSMLYKGADLIRDVEWVIFDEVHYINDLERGVVWEEVIIMLPAHVNLILLSATVPNTFEFADWIGRTKKKKVFVISTQKRPTPLEHYLWANDDMFKIVDGRDRTFLSLGYKGAVESFKEKQKPTVKGAPQPNFVPAAARMKAELAQWNKVVRTLREKNLLPVVVFSFSKRRCEDCAYGLANVDLSSGKEKSEIHVFFEQSMNRLKPADRKLPQVLRIKELLKRGIGVHHGGLLPIIKEVVEILFSRGLVKVLFATETFAMGVNMPARTVVFNALYKHDGQGQRELLPGEYTQMSGRAGRRGLDKVGTVIIACWHEVPEAGILKRIILGKATKLESQFRLTYNMILNLLRVEDFKVEDMIKRSFSESHSQRVIPEQQALLTQIENELKKAEDITCIYGEPDIANYQALNSELRQLDKEMQSFILASRQGLAALVPGRVVIVNTKTLPGALAVLIRATLAVGAAAISAAADAPLQRSFQFLVLTGRYVKRNIDATPAAGNVGHQLVDLPISAITSITTQRLRLDAQLDNVAIGALTQQLLRLLEATLEGPPPLDPIKEMKIQDIDFVEKSRRRAMLHNKATQSKCHTCKKLPEQYEAMDKQARLRRRMNQLRFALSDENLFLMPEFQNRCAVLQRLSYIDADKAVQLKGRVARELNTVSDELIATELIFENVLAELEPAEIVALMSSLLFDEKDASEAQLTERLAEAREVMIKLAVSLAHLQRECGLNISIDEQCKKLNFNLMEVVYEWARGMPFAEIVQLTNVLEGSIVRAIVRLDETCKEVRNAARIIGDATLYRKMEEASRLIKRDIVFASSLYLS